MRGYDARDHGLGLSIVQTVAQLNGIQHRPQQVELELQNVQRPPLRLACEEIAEGDLEPVFHVARGQRQARSEVLQPAGIDPRVVRGPAGEPFAMDLRGKQFRERGAYGFLPGLLPGEIHIGVDREANARNDVLERPKFIARQPNRLAESHPGLDATGVLLPAVVIEDSAYPQATLLAVRAVSENRGILARDIDLVIEAVGHPAANLRPAGATRVQHDVERMMNVVGLPLGTQLTLELRGRPRRRSLIRAGR